MTQTHAPQEFVRAIEALLFAADRPLNLPTLEVVLGSGSQDEIQSALGQLGQHYDGVRSGLVLVEVAGGYQLRTAPDLGALVGQLRESRPARLSPAALETLSIIAYRQPVTTSDVTELRGVDASGVIRTLLDMGIIRVLGRRETPGRPRLFGTTKRFLSLFGLRGLDDLPALRGDSAEVEPPPLLRTPDLPPETIPSELLAPTPDEASAEENTIE